MQSPRKILLLLAFLFTGAGSWASGVDGLDPHFSSQRGIYDRQFQVVISCERPEAQIVFTTDGTMPSEVNGEVVEVGKPVVLPVDKTMIVRAYVREGNDRSTVLTHTYLFPADILKQFKMVVSDEYRAEVIKSFSAAPIVSIVASHDDVFGEEGIYTNPLKEGEEWKKHCSFEWIPPKKKSAQVNCGIKIQGAAGRTRSEKKSFRLMFQKKFGAPKFKAKIFPESKVKQFDSLILRNPTHDSWTIQNPQWRKNARYVNDRWTAETHRLMGHLAPHHRWVHLFLNGSYWGVYDVCERPDEHFASAHLGGEDEGYDVFNADGLRSGSQEARNQLEEFIKKGGLDDPETFRTLQEHLDLNAFIDLVLLNSYSSNTDWLTRNYWLIGKQGSAPKFRFVSWDAEPIFWEKWASFENRRRQTGLNYNPLANQKILTDHHGIGFLMRHLNKSTRFKELFNKRAKLHLQVGGLLSNEKASARYRAQLDRVEKLLPAETARWGQLFDGEQFGIQTESWKKLTGEESWLFAEFFEKRSGVLFNLLTGKESGDSE